KRRVAVRIRRQGERWIGAIVYKGPRVGLVNFGAAPRRITIARSPRRGQKGVRWGRFRTGVTVRVMKGSGRQLVGEAFMSKHLSARETSVPAGHSLRNRKSAAFLATGRGGNRHVFYRVGRKRGRGDTLEAAHTWSIPEMVTNANGRAGGLSD